MKKKVIKCQVEPAVMAWQPIATAPRDGTYVLLGYFLEHGGGGPPVVAWWNDSYYQWQNQQIVLNAKGYFSPTHWAQLPPDPRKPSAPVHCGAKDADKSASAPVVYYTANGVLIVPGLRVRIVAIGHECETNVGTPAFDRGGLVRVVMVRGHKLMEPGELVAI